MFNSKDDKESLRSLWPSSQDYCKSLLRKVLLARERTLKQIKCSFQITFKLFYKTANSPVKTDQVNNVQTDLLLSFCPFICFLFFKDAYRITVLKFPLLILYVPHGINADKKH